ncbi:MAG: hypothetical protein RLZZ301_675 [Bacteroidota bacterium]
MIAGHHIKSIEGNYSTKKSNEGFKPSSDWFRYRFDQNGQLIESLEVHSSSIGKDSTIHQYAYNAQGLQVIHRYSAYGGFLSEHYRYDSLQRCTEIAYYKDQLNAKLDSVLSSVLMNKENLVYHDQSSSHSYTQYNGYKRPYLEGSKTYNTDGYLTEERIYYRISQSAYHTTYSYNEHGLLASKAHFDNDQTTASEEFRFRYDQWGNLIEKTTYKNGQLLTDFQIVYDYKTGFLGSTIRKDALTNNLLILRFTKYTYYPTHE